MVVVTDEVAGVAVDRAEEEHDVVRVDRVMAKVEERDRDDLGLEDEQANECLDLGRWDATREQLFGIFRKGIQAAKHHQFAPPPAIQDFCGRTCRMAARTTSQKDVRVQDCTKGARHLQALGDALMGSLKLVERFVRVDSGTFVGLGLPNGGGDDIASLGAVALAANDLQLGLMAKVHRNAKIQIRNAFQPGLHVWGNVESNAHRNRWTEHGEPLLVKQAGPHSSILYDIYCIMLWIRGWG